MTHAYNLVDELHSNRRMLRVHKKVDDEGHIGLGFTGSIPEIDSSRWVPCPVKRGLLF